MIAAGEMLQPQTLLQSRVAGKPGDFAVLGALYLLHIHRERLDGRKYELYVTQKLELDALLECP